MEPERYLCDDRDSVLQLAGLGTYRIVSRPHDGNGAYGYCEFLENNPEQNTIRNVAELRTYLERLCLLDRIATEMGISDLHYQNIATRMLLPTIIDAEVFDSPRAGESQIFDIEKGAAYRFDMGMGRIPNLVGINRIWFDASLNLDRSSRYGFQNATLQRLGIDLPAMRREVELTAPVRRKMEEAHRELRGRAAARIVLEETSALRSIMQTFHRGPDGAIEDFCRAIQTHIVNSIQFDFVEDALPQIREHFRTDCSNWDVPIFYYERARDVILYHGIVIGRRPAPAAAGQVPV